MPKTVFEYEGVPMSSLESMHFGFWLDKQDFYMNTLEKPERLKIINNWLNNHRASELTRDNNFLKAERDNQQKRLETGTYNDKDYKPGYRFENLEEWAKWHIQQLNKQIENNSKKIREYLSQSNETISSR